MSGSTDSNSIVASSWYCCFPGFLFWW